MIRTYKVIQYKLMNIITERITILLIFNKLKFNFAFKKYAIQLKRQKKMISIV